MTTTRILLTGFEPFGGQPINPSELVVEALASAPPAGVDLVTAILPVERDAAPRRALALLEEHRPDAVLALGQALGRSAISIETIAVNRFDDGSALVDGGPAELATGVDVERLLTATRESGAPAELSQSAGTFVCNAVIYALAHAGLVPALFVHLPGLPEQLPDGPSLSLEADLAGVRALLERWVEQGVGATAATAH